MHCGTIPHTTIMKSDTGRRMLYLRVRVIG